MEIRHLALSFQRPFSFDRRRYRHRLDDDFPPFFFSLAFRLSSTGRENNDRICKFTIRTRVTYRS